jgi:hypothetical protein
MTHAPLSGEHRSIVFECVTAAIIAHAANDRARVRLALLCIEAIVIGDTHTAARRLRQLDRVGVAPAGKGSRDHGAARMGTADRGATGLQGGNRNRPPGGAG